MPLSAGSYPLSPWRPLSQLSADKPFELFRKPRRPAGLFSSRQSFPQQSETSNEERLCSCGWVRPDLIDTLAPCSFPFVGHVESSLIDAQPHSLSPKARPSPPHSTAACQLFGAARVQKGDCSPSPASSAALYHLPSLLFRRASTPPAYAQIAAEFNLATPVAPRALGVLPHLLEPPGGDGSRRRSNGPSVAAHDGPVLESSVE